MKEKKKIILSVISVLLIIIVVVGVTYAYYRWRSSESIDVTINFDNSGDTRVTFYGGDSITGKITPTAYAYEGKVKHMTIETNLLANDTFNLYLKTNTLPNELKVDYFKWQLVSCDLSSNSSCASSADVNASGNFTTSSMSEFIDSVTGDMLLLENEPIPLHLDLYLYLWIDGNVDNDLNIGNKDINFDIYAKGTSKGSYTEGS